MENTRVYEVLRHLPRQLQDEIVRTCTPSGIAQINEIRIRREGCSSVVCDGRLTKLNSRVSGAQTEDILRSLMGGALYSHRESIA